MTDCAVEARRNAAAVTTVVIGGRAINYRAAGEDVDAEPNG